MWPPLGILKRRALVKNGQIKQVLNILYCDDIVTIWVAEGYTQILDEIDGEIDNSST